MTSKAQTGLNLTPKQEKFCQLYIELGNASEAYRQSYDADSMNENTVNREAKGLLDNPKIATRLEQLRKEHSKRHNITIDSLLIELEEARQAAFEGERVQVAAAVAATMGKAKLLGIGKQIETDIALKQAELDRLLQNTDDDDKEININIVRVSRKVDE